MAKKKDLQALTKKDYGSGVIALANSRSLNLGQIRRDVGEFDPEFIPLSRLRQMRKDPMIQMALYFLKAAQTSAKWHIESDDPEVAAGVDEILRKNYSAIMRVGLNSWDFGYQGSVKDFRLGEIYGKYEDENGKQQEIWPDKKIQPLILKRLVPVQPEFCNVNLDDNTAAYNGIDLGLNLGDPRDENHIPPEHTVWWTNQFEEEFMNYYGYPRTGYAYRYWWSYWFRWHMGDRHFEADADPPLQVWYPPGSQIIDGEEVTNQTIALNIGEDARNGATIAVPSTVYTDEEGKPHPIPLWKLEFLKGGENLQAFTESNEYIDVMKLRALLVPEQAVVEGKGGTSSRNVAGAFGDLMDKANNERSRDDDEVFNNYIIPQIVAANWGEGKSARKVTTGFQDSDIEFLHKLIELAMTADPNALPIDFEETIKIADIPMLSAEQQEEKEKAIEEAQQAMAAQGVPDGSVPDAPEPGENGDTGVTKQGLYFKPRERIHLSAEPVVSADAPSAEVAAMLNTRNNMTAADREKLQKILVNRYEDEARAAAQEMRTQAFQEAFAAAVVAAGAGAGAGGAAESGESAAGMLAMLGLLTLAVKRGGKKTEEPIVEVMQGLGHTAGIHGLSFLDSTTINPGILSNEIDKWARDYAGDLVTTLDETFVRDVLKPFLAEHIKAGTPKNKMARLLQKKIKDHDYPRWMAERVVRAEVRDALNEVGLNIWEREGIAQVVVHDGFGGKSGKTDPTCLARNNKIVSIRQARDWNIETHPNCTMFFTPYRR